MWRERYRVATIAASSEEFADEKLRIPLMLRVAELIPVAALALISVSYFVDHGSDQSLWRQAAANTNISPVDRAISVDALCVSDIAVRTLHDEMDLGMSSSWSRITAASAASSASWRSMGFSSLFAIIRYRNIQILLRSARDL
jgi:hypothetical protein